MRHGWVRRAPPPVAARGPACTLVDLIANCCVGFNSSTESPAQGFMSMAMNLDILQNPGNMRLGPGPPPRPPPRGLTRLHK